MRISDWSSDVCSSDLEEHSVYERAVSLLADLHKRRPADLRPYDRAEYQREAGLLTEWYCPAAGLEVDCDSYRAAWDEVLPLAEEDDAQKVTVLRDYHAENIMLIPDHDSSHGLGLRSEERSVGKECVSTCRS